MRRVKVSADGQGVVSHAGAGLLREMAEYTGLVDGVTEALLDTYKGLPVHPPGRVFTDLAVAVADGADAISGIAVLADRQDLFGPVASMPTTWRVLRWAIFARDQCVAFAGVASNVATTTSST